MFPQEQGSFYVQSAGSVNDVHFGNRNILVQQEEAEVTTQQPLKRSTCTDYYYSQLYDATSIQRPGEAKIFRRGGRKNRNEILSLTIMFLNKEKYLTGRYFTHSMELLRGLSMNLSSGEFVLVLRPNGRIIVMSDEAEYHLGKSMRSLYTQFINIFECLNKDEAERMETILNCANNLDSQEYSLLCTLRLPKGKRPSRENEDVKTISMTGHFYSCDDTSFCERLFIARCEALINQTTSNSNSSQPSSAKIAFDNSKSIINITLNEDLTVNVISSNTKEMLGYTQTEMIGNWFGRYLPTYDLDKLANIRQRFFQHEQYEQQQQQQQKKATPLNVSEILDIYTNHGDGCLTFLCQIRLKRQRRSKSVEFSIVAQLIDPSLRDDYVHYINSTEKFTVKAAEIQQVNLGGTSVSETNKDSVMVDSPSLVMGLLMSDNSRCATVPHQQQYSPIDRQLSNVVAPVNVDDESWKRWVAPLFDEYSTTPSTLDVESWPTNFFDDVFTKCQPEDTVENTLDSFFDDYFELNSYSS